jgi:hypothetical protein
VIQAQARGNNLEPWEIDSWADSSDIPLAAP